MTFDANGLELVVSIAHIVGIPVAIVVYALSKRRERLDREYGTYNALDEKYIDYLKLCMDHPELDVADVPRSEPLELTTEQRYRELIMFSILVSIMERAYLMYKDKSDNVRQTQWDGWSAYIADWCKRPNFVRAAPQVSTQFDRDFCAYLHSVIDAGAAAK